MPPEVSVLFRQVSRWVVGIGGETGGRLTGEQSRTMPGYPLGLRSHPQPAVYKIAATCPIASRCVHMPMIPAVFVPVRPIASRSGRGLCCHNCCRREVCRRNRLLSSVRKRTQIWPEPQAGNCPKGRQQEPHSASSRLSLVRSASMRGIGTAGALLCSGKHGLLA